MNPSSKILALLMFVFISFLALHGCKNDKDEPSPGLPPESSLVMDFSDFQNADTTLKRDMETYHNWWWAASNVVVWNTFITVGMAIPIASFREAFNHEAIYDPDLESWTWSYNFTGGGAIHLASLQAALVQDSVLWKMYISKQGAFSDVLWYYGTSDLDATGGYWIMNKDPLNPVQMLNITWHRNAILGTADIKYLNIIPDSEENGGYIHYGITNDTPFNAFYDIFNKGKDNLTNIQWNRITRAGEVKDPDHFGDTEWHCWNEMKQDVSFE